MTATRDLGITERGVDPGALGKAGVGGNEIGAGLAFIGAAVALGAGNIATRVNGCSGSGNGALLARGADARTTRDDNGIDTGGGGGGFTTGVATSFATLSSIVAH